MVKFDDVGDVAYIEANDDHIPSHSGGDTGYSNLDEDSESEAFASSFPDSKLSKIKYTKIPEHSKRSESLESIDLEIDNRGHIRMANTTEKQPLLDEQIKNNKKLPSKKIGIIVAIVIALLLLITVIVLYATGEIPDFMNIRSKDEQRFYYTNL